jgi:hypothetical protein
LGVQAGRNPTVALSDGLAEQFPEAAVFQVVRDLR